MRRYEIQVLESYENLTYADGQAAAIYGQWPPLVNASRPQGEWNVYDIFFETPRFEGDKLLKPAFVTVATKRLEAFPKSTEPPGLMDKPALNTSEPVEFN